jgi:hypothetical protein
MNEPRVVALLGYAQSGKDEAAKVLVEEGGFVRVAFADAVRECLLALDPHIQLGPNSFVGLSSYVYLWGWDKAKQNPDVRRLLQRLGTEVVRDRIDSRAWADIGRSKVTDAIEQGRSVVVTDVRFPNEVTALLFHEAPVLFVLVKRSGVGPVNDHSSELETIDLDELRSVKGAEVASLYNSGTLAEWHDTVRREILGVAVK